MENITHIIAAENDDAAVTLIEEIRKGTGSDSCPRRFASWQEHRHCKTAKGTIAGKTVTLVVGEYDRNVVAYRLESDCVMGRRQMRPGTTMAKVNRRVSVSRIVSLADTLSALLFLHGQIGLAPDKDARAARSAKTKVRAAASKRLRRHETIGLHSWC